RFDGLPPVSAPSANVARPRRRGDRVSRRMSARDRFGRKAGEPTGGYMLGTEGTSMPYARVISVIAITTLLHTPTLAQPVSQWPDRPVRLLVPVGAGGAADTLSRNLSNGFAQFANGQPLIVENRPGAGGTIAAAAMTREKPDGYTLFLAEVGPNAISHKLTSKLPYDPHTAFTPIVHAANLPAVVLIRPALPYKTLADFIAAAKQQPGKFNYA